MKKLIFTGLVAIVAVTGALASKSGTNAPKRILGTYYIPAQNCREISCVESAEFNCTDFGTNLPTALSSTNPRECTGPTSPVSGQYSE